jgi:serine/threonine protein kinase
MPWQDVVEVGAKVAAALEVAHRARVLHRDIKPQNLLFSDFAEPVLVDFGIATVEGGFQTRSTSVSATVAHAAPEILEGVRATERSDVYSLASTLHTAIRGAAPFADDGPQPLARWMQRIASEPPPSLAPHGVPLAICEVIDRALAKAPGDRPGSADEFRSELVAAAARVRVAPDPDATKAVARVATSSPTVAGVSTDVDLPAATRARRPANRHVVSLGVLAALLVAAAVIWSNAGGGHIDLADRAGASRRPHGTGRASSAPSTSQLPPSTTNVAVPSTAPWVDGSLKTSAPKPPVRSGRSTPMRASAEPSKTSATSPSTPPVDQIVAPGAPHDVVVADPAWDGGACDDPSWVRVTVRWTTPQSGGSPIDHYDIVATNNGGASPVRARASGSSVAATVTLPALSAPPTQWWTVNVTASNAHAASVPTTAQVQVPDVLSRCEWTATRFLSSLGLATDYAREVPTSDPAKCGGQLVTLQSRAAGSTVSTGTRVTLTAYSAC